jgi:hypothetical protein
MDQAHELQERWWVYDPEEEGLDNGAGFERPSARTALKDIPHNLYKELRYRKGRQVAAVAPLIFAY